MNKQVQAFLEEKRKEQEQKAIKEKNGILSALNLCIEKKVFSPEKTKKTEYPYVNYDEEEDNCYYTEKEAIEVSEEEYAEILKYIEKKNPLFDTEEEYSLRNWGTFIGILGIVCILAAICVLTVSALKEYVLAIILVCAGISLLFEWHLCTVFANISISSKEILRRIIKNEK